jgi:hypothetical protein
VITPHAELTVTRRAWKIWLSLVGIALLADNAVAQSRVLLELEAGRDFQGPAHYATVDDNGVAWIAAPRQLYRIEHGTPIPVGPPVSAGGKIVLAPSGERLARLVRGKSRFGHFVVDLVDPSAPAVTIATLTAPSGLNAFSGIYVGRRGNVLVTTTPEDNAEAIAGRFTYAFWSKSGQYRNSLTLPGPRMGVLNEKGDAILLFGETGVDAIQQDGTLLWNLTKSYRSGVLANGGEIAILNPALEIDEVHLVNRGAVAVSRLAAPVHAIAVTPDGAVAAVATDKGRVYLLDLQSCRPDVCTPTELRRLPIHGTYYVSDIRFVDSETLAIAIFRSTGTPRSERFDEGAVLVVTTRGGTKLRKQIPLPQPPTWSPLLNVTYGQREFVAYTRDTVYLIEVDN